MYLFMMFITYLYLKLSVDCHEFPSRVIWSNVSQMVVSYKTCQFFCSDVVVQPVHVHETNKNKPAHIEC